MSPVFSVSRLRQPEFSTGKSNTYDSYPTPHLKTSELAQAFELAESKGQGKSQQVPKVMKMAR